MSECPDCGNEQVDASHGRVTESLGDRIDWSFLVSTAAGGVSMLCDIAFFRHRYMELVGALTFVIAFVGMATLTIVSSRKGRCARPSEEVKQ